MKNRTRRQFLKDSAKTVTAAALISSPMIVPTITKAADKNGKLLCAVMGVRSRGNNHIDGYIGRSDCEIAYIVDIDEKVGIGACNSIEKKTGKRPKLVADMRRVFDDKEIDFVSCATPNHWHAISGVWAMQAGKDVYLEKPISHDIPEGTALVAAAKKYKKICQVGTQCRSNPAIINAMKFIHDGGIGEVKLARGLCYKRRKSIGPLGDYKIPDGVDFNLWSGPAEYTDPKLTRQQFHYDWHWQRLYGNGDSGNQGPHQTDIARWGLGINTHPRTVVAYGGRLGYQAERKDDNYVDAGDTANTEIAIYDYGDKTMVFETRGLAVDNPADEEINRVFGSKGNKIGVIFYGTKGTLVQRSYTDCSAYDLNGKEFKRFRGGGDHFGNFVEAVKSRDESSLNSDAYQGHLSAALAHLANISIYVGEQNKVSLSEAKSILSKIKSYDDNLATFDRTIKHLKENRVDLDKYPLAMGPMLKFDVNKEVFTNSSDANALLHREYRKPFVCPTADKV